MEIGHKQKRSQNIVLDASSVIDLIEIGLLEVVLALPYYRFGLPHESFEEIKRPFQRACVEAAIQSSTLALLVIDDPAEMALKEEIAKRLGAGEAACLAIAITRGWGFACEERNRKFEREIAQRLGEARVFRVEDLLATMVREGLRSMAEITTSILEAAASCISIGEAEKRGHLERIHARVRALLMETKAEATLE